ncbi:MAG: defense against restriction DarA-related protein [Methylobacter sp.]
MENIIDTFINIENAAHAGAFGANQQPIPTEAQCAAGNYKVGRGVIYGLPVAIEQPRHSYRTGIGADGKRWTNRMAAHYGYFSGTKGADGDPVDCFIGYYPQSEYAWIINQNINGKFDEHKVMLAMPDEETARKSYTESYDKGWNGLHSIVKASIDQLKWWLKNGNTTKPLLPAHLPYEGLETMNQQRVTWDATQNPESMTLDKLLYEIRRADAGANLVLDAVTMADILEQADEVMALDALTSPYVKLQRKMEILQAVMERTGGAVKPEAMQLSAPFKQSGVAQVAAVFELSDGQTVSIFFHNPDVNPKKITATDELISWKWLLNKKDITIVVAPERGQDLNVKAVAERIIKLAEKNSAAFQRANTKRAENLAAIESLKAEIPVLEKQLADVQHELEVVKMEVEDGAKPVEQSQEEIRLAEGKKILSDVVGEFEGTISEWQRSDALGLWDYADVTVNGITGRVGVSGGGVVSINGKPHDPEGKVNDNEQSIKMSIMAAFPEPDQTSQEKTAEQIANEIDALATAETETQEPTAIAPVASDTERTMQNLGELKALVYPFPHQPIFGYDDHEIRVSADQALKNPGEWDDETDYYQDGEIVKCSPLVEKLNSQDTFQYASYLSWSDNSKIQWVVENGVLDIKFNDEEYKKFFLGSLDIAYEKNSDEYNAVLSDALKKAESMNLDPDKEKFYLEQELENRLPETSMQQSIDDYFMRKHGDKLALQQQDSNLIIPTEEEQTNEQTEITQEDETAGSEGGELAVIDSNFTDASGAVYRDKIAAFIKENYGDSPKILVIAKDEDGNVLSLKKTTEGGVKRAMNTASNGEDAGSVEAISASNGEKYLKALGHTISSEISIKLPTWINEDGTYMLDKGYSTGVPTGDFYRGVKFIGIFNMELNFSGSSTSLPIAFDKINGIISSGMLKESDGKEDVREFAAEYVNSKGRSIAKVLKATDGVTGEVSYEVSGEGFGGGSYSYNELINKLLMIKEYTPSMKRLNGVDFLKSETGEKKDELTTSQAHIDTLQAIVDGSHDSDDLMTMLDTIDAAATALIDAGLGEQYDDLIGKAAEKWAELDAKTNG